MSLKIKSPKKVVASATVPFINAIILSGIVARISVERSANGAARFVVAIATSEGRLQYFSVMLENEQSAEIGATQLRNAFVELSNVMSPFQYCLVHRSKMIGSKVSYSVSEQTDKSGRTVLNPKTQKPYTNVRLEPTCEDLSEEAAMKLLSGLGSSGPLPDDINS